MEIRKKLALFCNVNLNSVIEAIDAETIYDVPLLMRKEKLDERVLSKLKVVTKQEPELEQWKSFLGKLKNPVEEVNIGLVGKYVSLPDAYKSIAEAFIHAGAQNDCKVRLKWISSEEISKDTVEVILGGLHGVLVAPGFGERGLEGKIEAIRYVRENKIPFLGICLGMQCAVVEFARNVLGLDASSTELNPKTRYPVIDMMEEQKKITTKGGTMRLGSYACKVKKGTKAYTVYGDTTIHERHRHRYEFNNKYLHQIEEAGLKAVGVNPDSELVEIVELKDHPWFLGVQYHPELRSTVLNPHPLFVRFVEAALKNKKNDL
jgi:CTP synthase